MRFDRSAVLERVEPEMIHGTLSESSLVHALSWTQVLAEEVGRMDDVMQGIVTEGSGFDDSLVGYTVDRFGQASPAQVVGSLLDEVDLGRVSEAIDAYGLEAVAEQYLRALIADGTLHTEEAAADEECERMLDDEDGFGVPKVHAVTVADLADELTRLGLLEPPPSCRR